MSNHELLLEREVCDLTRIHPATRYRMIQRGEFPKPMKIGSLSANGRNGWLRAEIMKWIADRVAARNKSGTSTA
jgi:predicted DNA-binding transcriptional regulator AlpA